MVGTYERVAASIRDEIAICEVTVIQGGPGIGAKMLVFSDGAPEGTLGLGELEQTVIRDAREAIRASRSETRSYVLPGNSTESETQLQLFFESNVPAPRLIIVGAGHTSIPLSSFARLAGFKVTLIDARAAFATPERFQDVDEILVEWPHEAVAHMSLSENTYIAVLTHDAKFEEPLLPLLLQSRARYIGVIGSRKTQLQRRERLRREGFDEMSISRLSGPIGLDLGAVTPQEIALSILSEIVATQHGRAGGTLTSKLLASIT